MNVKKAGHDDIAFMCTDSEKQIAKLEWFSPTDIGGLVRALILLAGEGLGLALDN